MDGASVGNDGGAADGAWTFSKAKTRYKLVASHSDFDSVPCEKIKQWPIRGGKTNASWSYASGVS